MATANDIINIKVNFARDVHEIKTHRGEYRNLMQLLNNSIYLENFGECGGQGRCATCLVEISGLNGKAGLLERNEEVTIQKAGLPGLNMRMACQILITEDLQDAIIDICE